MPDERTLVFTKSQSIVGAWVPGHLDEISNAFVGRELEAAGSLHVLWDPGGCVAPCGCFICCAAGLWKLNGANVLFLGSSLSCCPILMLLRSGVLQTTLLIHFPAYLIDCVVQFNLQLGASWSLIRDRALFQSHEGDYTFRKGTQHRDWPDEFFIWLFIFFQFTL